MKLDLEPILEYAKELYLTPDEEGNHKYSLQNIVDLIRQKFDKKFTRETIRRWAEKYGWKTLWEEAVRKGLTQAIKAEYAKGKDKDKELDEKYEELIAKKKRDDFLRATQLKILGFKYIQEHGFSSVSDALKAIEIGMKYTEDAITKVEAEVKSEDAKRVEEAIRALTEAIAILNRNSSEE